MAYMNQDKKKAIVAQLKKIIPLDWKWSVAVENHSTLHLNIASAPVDLIGEMRAYTDPAYHNYVGKDAAKPSYAIPNHHWLDNAYKGELLVLFENIKEAMMFGNHDNSDIMTDYFDVGHYISINLGKWNRPFIVN